MVDEGPWQNRDKTVPVEPTWVAFERKSRFPKLLKNLKVEINERKLWSGLLCAQGRCATRLRYAPTLYYADSKLLLDIWQEGRFSTVAKP
jgi:hypothetical protein